MKPAEDFPAPGSIAAAVMSNISLSAVLIIVQIGTFSVLARILTPGDYGVFAFANAILVYIAHLSQKGLSATLIRRKTVSAEDYGAACIISIAMALLAVSVLAVIWAMLRTALPHRAMHADILLFMALPLALQILAAPAMASLQRRFRFAAINLIQIAGIVAGNGIVAVVLGLQGWGPWSLAFGAATNALVVIGLNLFLARDTLTLRTTRHLLRTHAAESLHFNIVRSLDVAWVQLPVLVLTFISPAGFVGIYQRIQFLADLALQMTVWRVTGVLYNALAQHGDGHTIGKARYRLVLQLCGLLILPIVAFTLMSAETIILVLLGPQWLAGAPLLRWLVVAFGLSSLNHPAGMALEHAGKLQARTLQSGLTVLVLMLLCPLYLLVPSSLYGLPAAISMAFSCILIYAAAGERPSDLPAILGGLLPGAILAVPVALGAAIPRWLLPALAVEGPAFALLLAELTAAALGGLLGLLLVTRLPGMRALLRAGETAMPGLFMKLRVARHSWGTP